MKDEVVCLMNSCFRGANRAMKLRQALTLCALAIGLSTSCYAITFTENAAIFKGDDSRLEQKVDCDADGIPVAQVLGKLSQSTGVSMIAGLDKDDWMAQDRGLIVHVKDAKLITLMQELSSVLRFHWSRTGSADKSVYYLWQDNQQRAEEDSLRAAADDNQTRAAREKRENTISDLANLGSLSEADAAKLKANDPWRYILATEPLGRGLTEFLNNFPDARNAFIQGTEASFPVSALSPQLQDTVHKIADSYDSLAQKANMFDNHSQLLSQFDKLQITINRQVSIPGAETLYRSLLGRITIASESEKLDIPLYDPASAAGRALGKAILALEAGTPKEQVTKQIEADMTAAMHEPQVDAKPSRDINSDPAFKAPIKLFDVATAAPLPITLKALAEKSKLNVISDYFPGKPPTIAGGEKSLGEQLQAIGTAYGTNWEKAGNMLRFRDLQWFNKRAWQVPQVWLDYWIERARMNNGLQLIDLVQIGCLRDVQIDHTIMMDPVLTRYGAGDAARNRNILQFYGLLTDDQRKSMVNEHLTADSLTDDQWAALQKALATKGAAYAASTKGTQFIQLSQSGSDAIEYTFSYFAGANDPPVTFKLQTGVLYKTDDELPSLPPKVEGNKAKKK